MKFHIEDTSSQTTSTVFTTCPLESFPETETHPGATFEIVFKYIASEKGAAVATVTGKDFHDMGRYLQDWVDYMYTEHGIRLEVFKDDDTT